MVERKIEIAQKQSSLYVQKNLFVRCLLILILVIIEEIPDVILS
nr:MAG TPA: hypothetical protein [Caudoviricetes sp.]